MLNILMILYRRNDLFGDVWDTLEKNAIYEMFFVYYSRMRIKRFQAHHQ